ncbi:arabinan endo-1,5-alpha-L-arabinosidase [Acidipila sp. EB88]|uniref:arabinan endo-1,5-alpha-L-arabinosidase n=1 Tax=Acidipila sp. EB88 TaxID=2305226 RepID=UPI000F5F82C2|nr:arabinan endo-1,5-alpha-L-arabinosidase [Acidipila sp. EB88]RRA49697.1 arabinan endo-1,5-alpha-L-arabinosidase [Acidipila sp. EB88]
MPRRHLSLAACSALLLIGLQSGCGHGEHRLRHGAALGLSRYYNPLASSNPASSDVIPVHDPSLARAADGTYVAFTTDLPFLHSRQLLAMRCSRDLLVWHSCGYVFPTMPEWARQEFPEAVGLWAPDISYFNGQYHLYYTVSSLGSQHSAIALATSPTLDPAAPGFHWTDRGVILRSHTGDDFNAIDAAILVDPGDPARIWLTYGSFWHGIFQQEVQASTGRLVANSTRYHLAEQPSDREGAIEGSAMVAHHGWYYLFASVGICCAMPIERDTYQQIVGRSRSPHGPFVAEDGSPLLRGGGTILLTSDEHWLAPGGGSLLLQGEDVWLAFHALDRRNQGALNLWVEHVEWRDDWPVLTPQAAPMR